MIGWTGIRCPECGAEPGEESRPTCLACSPQECFETDRVWGKLPLKGVNSHHEERILLVLRANRPEHQAATPPGPRPTR